MPCELARERWVALDTDCKIVPAARATQRPAPRIGLARTEHDLRAPRRVSVHDVDDGDLRGPIDDRQLDGVPVVLLTDIEIRPALARDAPFEGAEESIRSVHRQVVVRGPDRPRISQLLVGLDGVGPRRLCSIARTDLEDSRRLAGVVEVDLERAVRFVEDTVRAQL